MTKEELKKEAEEYALKQWEGNIPWSVIQKSYYDSALPREKRIANLEAQLEAEKKLNEEIKVRFVKCNTCTDEMKGKCLMFSENLCEGDRCEELVDLLELINKSDLQKENAELKEKIEKMKCCENCKGVCTSDDVVHFCKNNNYKLWEIK